MKTIFTLKEDHGEDLKEITVDENNIIIDCQPSDIYRNFLTGKKIVNGFTNDNLSGTPKFSEPIYFADTPETKTYCVLKSTKDYTFEIDRVKKIATCKICGCDEEHACVNFNEEPCHWVEVDYQKGTGICSYCVNKEKIKIKNE